MSVDTQKSLLERMVKELGDVPEKTIQRMTIQAGELLAETRRPLIVDEMDHLVQRKSVELIRDIYEISGAPILLIGEEHMPARLARWERFHNRLVSQVKAVPANFEDAKAIRDLYEGQIKIDDILLERLLMESKGVIRRLVTLLDGAKQKGLNHGISSMTVSAWEKAA